MKQKYLSVDNYEMDMEKLGYGDTIEEIRKIEKQRVEDTDGECYLLRYELNEETGKYKCINAK